MPFIHLPHKTVAMGVPSSIYAGIDYSHPLSRGIVGAWRFGQTINSVAGSKIVSSSGNRKSSAFAGHAGAYAGDFAINNNYISVFKPPGIDANNATMEVVFILEQLKSTASYVTGLMSAYVSEAEFACHLILGEWNNSAAIGRPSYELKTSAGWPKATIGKSVKQNKITYVGGSYNKNKIVCACDGGYADVGETGSATFGPSSNLWIGCDFDLGDNRSLYGLIMLAIIRNVALSASEMVEMSKNPWQIFAPERRIIYFDVGASVRRRNRLALLG